MEEHPGFMKACIWTGIMLICPIIHYLIGKKFIKASLIFCPVQTVLLAIITIEMAIDGNAT
jgi:hypothetical protein